MARRGDSERVANRLRARRLAFGLEQWQVAERIAVLAGKPVGMEAGMVSRHERGVSKPCRYYRRLYCQLLDAEEDELWPRRVVPPGWATANPAPGLDQDPVLVAAWDAAGAVESAAELMGGGGPVERRGFLALSGAALTAPAHQWLVNDPGPLTAALQGDRVTPALTDRLPPMIAELRRMGDLQAPRVVHDLAAGHARWVVGLLKNASYDESVARRLQLALAEFGQIAGSTAGDFGDVGLSQRCHITGLRAAHAAGDRGLAAHVVRGMAAQSMHRDQHREAVTLVDSALAGGRGVHTVAQVAFLQSTKARACAALGDMSASTASISAARDAADRMHVGDFPPWLYWLTRDHIAAYVGDALLRLDRPAEAEPLVARAVAGLPSDCHLGDRQAFVARLSSAQLATGKLDEAVHTGHGALDLAEQWVSAYGRYLLRLLCRDVQEHQDTPAAREFLDRAAGIRALA